uniref:Major facilitator superfamily (MFS) profile domain-containing protein n=1 Tax=Acrobeloides nanus TaxID=290746 RepID=A0A914DGJ1_9BILA
MADSQEKLKKDKDAVKLDDFIVLGRYSLLICLLSEFMILNQVGNMLYMAYSGAAPKLTGCGDTVFPENITAKAACVEFTRLENDTGCKPTLEPQFKSVNYEWEYICSGTTVVKQSISVQMIGVIIGALLFGQLSDMFGRKWTLFSTLLFSQVFMIISSFTPNLLWFTVCRFFVNIFNGGSITINMVNVNENLPKKDRLWINNIVTWAPNMIILAGVAYLTQNWRVLTVVSAIIATPGLIFNILISESPRYLIQKGKIQEAKQVIERMCKIDGRPFDKELLDHVLDKETKAALESKSKSKNYTFFHLFYTLDFALYTIAIGFSFLVVSIMNYSILFNMEKLSGSIYVNAVLIAAFRYALNLIMAPCEMKFAWLGRKVIHTGSLTLIAFAAFSMLVLTLLGLQVQLPIIISVASVGIVAVCSQLFIVNAVVSNELFPTAVRNLAYASSQFCARIGVVLAPLIFLLAGFWEPLPYIAMVAIVTTDLLFFHSVIPETKGKPMADRMPGPENRLFKGKNSKPDVELKDLEASKKLTEDVEESH